MMRWPKWRRTSLNTWSIHWFRIGFCPTTVRRLRRGIFNRACFGQIWRWMQLTNSLSSSACAILSDYAVTSYGIVICATLLQPPYFVLLPIGFLIRWTAMPSKTTSSVAGFVMSLVTITEGSLTCLVSSLVLILIVHHQLHSQMKRRDRISLVLSSILLLVTNVRTLLGDLYELDFDTSSCVIHGYFTLATICTLYYGFVVQLSISSALDEDAETAFAVSGCLPSLPHRALSSTMLPP